MSIDNLKPAFLKHNDRTQYDYPYAIEVLSKNHRERRLVTFKVTIILHF